MSYIKSNKLNHAISKFIRSMRNRLVQKEDDGWYGWDDEEVCSTQELLDRATEKIHQMRITPTLKDAVDVANLVMFVASRLDPGKNSEKKTQ